MPITYILIGYTYSCPIVWNFVLCLTVNNNADFLVWNVDTPTDWEASAFSNFTSICIRNAKSVCNATFTDYCYGKTADIRQIIGLPNRRCYIELTDLLHFDALYRPNAKFNLYNLRYIFQVIFYPPFDSFFWTLASFASNACSLPPLTCFLASIRKSSYIVICKLCLTHYSIPGSNYSVPWINRQPHDCSVELTLKIMVGFPACAPHRAVWPGLYSVSPCLRASLTVSTQSLGVRGVTFFRAIITVYRSLFTHAFAIYTIHVVVGAEFSYVLTPCERTVVSFYTLLQA